MVAFWHFQVTSLSRFATITVWRAWWNDAAAAGLNIHLSWNSIACRHLPNWGLFYSMAVNSRPVRVPEVTW